jgi:uncharacterized protein YndB with AHSA1/START domain
MLKWILGIVAVLVVGLMGTCWYGYNKLTSGGSTATVTIAAAPERAWTYFTNPDSFRVWQDSNTVVTFSTDSLLAVGDTVWLESRGGSDNATRQRMMWALERVEAPRLLVWAARDDSSRVEIVRRTDSLVAVGDSVRVVSVFDTPGMDSIRVGDSVGGFGGRLLGGASKMAAGAMRMLAERDLARLKVRLELRGES